MMIHSADAFNSEAKVGIFVNQSWIGVIQVVFSTHVEFDIIMLRL